MTKLNRTAVVFMLIAGLGLIPLQADAQTFLPTQIDRTLIDGGVSVNPGSSQEFVVSVQAETLLGFLERDTSINLDNLFSVTSVNLPQGMRLVTNDNDENGRKILLERNGGNEGLKIKLELKVSADGIGTGSYLVFVTLENTVTKAKLPVAIEVTVR